MVKTRSMIHNELMINSDIVTNTGMESGTSRSLTTHTPMAQRPSVRTYKSIIRTRSQKLREREAMVKQLFSDCNMFYSMYKREPSSSSKDLAEQRLGEFLQGLRYAILDENLTEKAVQKQLSWFKYEQKVVNTWSFGDVMLNTFLFGLLPVALISAQYYAFLCLTDSYCKSQVFDFSQFALTTVGGTFIAIDRYLFWATYELCSYFSQFMTWALKLSQSVYI